MKLDPKGLEAAREQPGTNHDGIIRAYLTALTPAEVGGLVERLLRADLDAVQQAASLIQSQAARIAELAAVVADLATDLEAELNARYGMDPVHPAEARRKERDMEPVQRARSLLNGERKG